MGSALQDATSRSWSPAEAPALEKGFHTELSEGKKKCCFCKSAQQPPAGSSSHFPGESSAGIKWQSLLLLLWNFTELLV